MFSMTPTDRGFDVTGVEFTNTSGQMEKLQPLLNTPISISGINEPVSKMLDDIA